MVRSFKEQTKINWNESKYKSTLTSEEIKVYKSLSREQKDEAVWEWLNDNPINLLEKENKFKDEREEEKRRKKEEKDNKLKDFFLKQGIPNPTNATLEVFKRQQIFANFDNFYHAFGQLTFNMEKQATYNYYMTNQKQIFIQIAQNDKIIKQNEEIIELLKVIANK